MTKLSDLWGMIRRMTLRLPIRRALALAALVVAAGVCAPAAAQTFTPTVLSAPNLGTVVAGPSGTTTFRFDTNGTVTVVSGAATRASAGAVRGEVEIACAGGNVCSGGVSRVRIGSIGTPTGKLRELSNFTVAIGSGGTITNVTGTNPIDFTLTQTNKSKQPVVYFGADVDVRGMNGSGSPGAATSGFYVYVAPSPTVPTTGVSGNLTANIVRPIAITGSTTMAFGTVVKPKTGNGTVTLDPNTNVRTVTGNGAAGVPNPTPARASYTVTGEGGQAISITVPETFSMNRTGGGGITVTLTTSTLPTLLSASPGTEGTASFNVGGNFGISANLAAGDYSGSFAVTAQYN